ncbi:hypothetical protein FA15DRAFT_652791 [Coprinopsis marcescibilis]|uniref:Uncharacterized protein n=1 Tax=Coprinopsis marcescibilis TaxID=230819 RepID=A0A5C3L750_COPMA|nr:hypothetical protein FA15DRAFT_652791 [Coprinopsis marcescibilis]
MYEKTKITFTIKHLGSLSFYRPLDHRVEGLGHGHGGNRRERSRIGWLIEVEALATKTHMEIVGQAADAVRNNSYPFQQELACSPPQIAALKTCLVTKTQQLYVKGSLRGVVPEMIPTDVLYRQRKLSQWTVLVHSAQVHESHALTSHRNPPV